MKRATVPSKIRSYVKNQYLFLHSLNFNPTFFDSYNQLVEKWNPSFSLKKSGEDTSFLGYAHACKSVKEVETKQAEANKRTAAFLKKLGKQEDSFFDDIVLFLEKNDLGKEWVMTIADFIVSGWLSHPNQNLYIYKKEDGRKTVVLELNPDTSLADIKKFWPRIESAQKELRPKYKKQNVTVKMYDNLHIAISDIVERAHGPLIDDVAGDRKYKMKDIDLVARLWGESEDDSESADLRKSAKLRKIRQRFSKKK